MLFARDYLTDQTVLRSPGAPAQPLVSVVLPTYARGKNGMLKRALESVLAQTMPDFELLVMDDGSTDGTSDLIENIRKHEPRLIHVRHERNSGIHSVRLNEGIALARGTHVAFQFDDDLWHPQALQALVAASRRLSDETVVVGKSHVQGANGEWVLPVAEVNLISLYEQNRFANNSVLIPRILFDRYGMYDCHIGMRRLCDWDLWLRLFKHVPFFFANELVSEVYELTPGSLGVTVPWDLSLFRYLHDIPRDPLLTPAKWLDYEIDGLRIGGVDIEGGIQKRLYEEQIAPYYMRFRHHFPVVEGFHASLPSKHKTVLWTKGAYDTSTEVGLGHYDSLANRRGSYKAYFQPVAQVGPEWTEEADALLLVRTVEDQAQVLMHQALQNDIPVGMYLDDDLLTFHEFGPQFGYLAPGTPYHTNLKTLLAGADAVWATTPYLQEAVREHNPRVLPHNGAVPAHWLPSGIRPRTAGKPWRIAYVGSGYRTDEFRIIWDALHALSQEHGERLCFEFWGLDVSKLPPLASPVTQRPFTFSYFHYLRQLRQAEFDILLSPLLDYPRPRLAKSIPKYYESAVAGALSIFSDVPQYSRLPDRLTCLKAKNTAPAWHEAISSAISMPGAEFDLMRRRALEHVREEFTASAQIHLHEAAWRATEFHAKTRGHRYADGRPRVMYVLHSAHLGGGEILLLRRAMLARLYGIEPIIVLPRTVENSTAARSLHENLARDKIQVEYAAYACFDEPRQVSEARNPEVRELLERCAPAAVHTTTFVPAFGQVTADMDIPHVASLFQLDDALQSQERGAHSTHCALAHSDTMRFAQRWSRLLGVEGIWGRGPVPLELFALGQRRYLANLDDAPARSNRVRMVAAGTIQARKRQLETIEAFGILGRDGADCTLDFYGYTHFFPEYLAKCLARVRELDLAQRVSFRDFESDMANVLQQADIMLSLSTFESLPLIIQEAMAAGVLVVATPIGGIHEVVIDGVSGILCSDTSTGAMADGMRRALALSPADRQRIVQQARRVARSEFHPDRAANDLMEMYNRALEMTRARGAADGRPLLRATGRTPARPYEIVHRPTGSPLGHRRVGAGLSYHVTPGGNRWTGLGVLVGTNQRPASGRLQLRIRAPSGGVLRTSAVDLVPVTDNSWVHFHFSPIMNAANLTFVLEFNVVAAGPGTLISLYETTPPDRPLRRWIRRAGFQWIGDSLYCSLHHAE